MYFLQVYYKHLAKRGDAKMSYLVFCTFDLKNATAQDYKNAYLDLEKIGLNKISVSSQGSNIVIPTTSVMGAFNGENASSICNYIRDQVRQAFNLRNFKSEIFITAGMDWAWIAGTT